MKQAQALGLITLHLGLSLPCFTSGETPTRKTGMPNIGPYGIPYWSGSSTMTPKQKAKRRASRRARKARRSNR